MLISEEMSLSSCYFFEFSPLLFIHSANSHWDSMVRPYCTRCLGCRGKKKSVRYLSHGGYCTEGKADIKQMNNQLDMELEIMISCMKEKGWDG